MSRLINPGAGDLSDRLTILALKRLIGEEQGKPTDHWRHEQVALLSQICARTLNGAWFEDVLDLAAVNATLWHAEDELRDWRKRTVSYPDEGALIVNLAFRIQTLNDRRANLIAAINKKAGDELGSEKLKEGA